MGNSWWVSVVHFATYVGLPEGLPRYYEYLVMTNIAMERSTHF
jgi:hypothetical protein